jgi:hypothetical protein
MILGSMAFNNDMQPLNYSPFIVGLAAASPGAIPSAALDTDLGVFPVVAPKENS